MCDKAVATMAATMGRKSFAAEEAGEVGLNADIGVASPAVQTQTSSPAVQTPTQKTGAGGAQIIGLRLAKQNAATSTCQDGKVKRTIMESSEGSDKTKANYGLAKSSADTGARGLAMNVGAPAKVIAATSVRPSQPPIAPALLTKLKELEVQLSINHKDTTRNVQDRVAKIEQVMYGSKSDGKASIEDQIQKLWVELN